MLPLHQQEGQGEQEQHLHRQARGGAVQPAGQSRAQPQPGGQPQRDGGRYGEQRGGGEAAALCHAGKGGKEHDDKDVVHRCPGQNQLGDALLRPPALVHQPDHPGDDDCRGDGGHHRAHDGRVQRGNAQQPGRQQYHAEDLKAGGDKAHEKGGTAHPLQVGQVQGESRPGENDDEGQLPQIGRNGEHGGGEQIQLGWPQQDARQEHAQQTGQVEPLGHGRAEEPQKQDERKTCQHENTVLSGI